MNQSTETQSKNNVLALITSGVFVVAMSVFCYLSNYSLIIPVLILFLGVHLYLTEKAGLRMFLNLGLLLALITSTAHFIISYSELSYFYTPVAGIAMLTILLFNNFDLALIMAICSSIIVSSVVGGDFGTMTTFFIGSLMGAYSVKDARGRGQLFSAGLFVSAIHVVCLFLLQNNSHQVLTREFTVHFLNPLLLNGFISALLVLATLKIFEILFGVLTNFSLLELSDYKQPLLKRMAMEAPGTYHHSLVVSNLAEAAADAIGANSLLTRVGAYYHDIGKMIKSEYFTENQAFGFNVHDKIEPSMSRLVILNHVKEGIELAKKHKLNPLIIDFIPEHHGTSLMYYFYQKALEEAEEGVEVKEEDFRYPGPKPQKRETAITLLADSVEGAVRALDEPNPTKIEETVKKIVNNKFIDGQLDECPLTLKEIDKISATFIRILSAMYHGRVKYPEKKNGSAKERSAKNGHNGRKSSKESKAESRPDQKDNPTHS